MSLFANPFIGLQYKPVSAVVGFFLLWAVDQGYVTSQYNLALMYESGKHIQRDLGEAVRLYKLAADQGHANAQFNLAQCCKDGNGVERDLSEASRLYKLAADHTGPGSVR